MSQPTSGPPPQRRSWGRRLARWAAWTSLAVSLVALAGWGVVESDWAAQAVRARIELAASEALGVEVTLGEIEIDLLPPAVEARRIRIEGAGGGAEPLADVDRVSVGFGPGLLGGLRGSGPILLREIEVVAPRLLLTFAGDGTSNLPELGGDRGDDAGLEVRIGRVTVLDGELTIEQRSVPLAFEASDLIASAEAAETGGWVARARSPEVTLSLLDGEPLDATARLAAIVDASGVEVREARLEGPLARLEARGRVARQEIGLEIEGEGDLELLARLGLFVPPEPARLEGRARFRGDLGVGAEAWSLTGEIDGDVAWVESGGDEGLDASAELSGTFAASDRGWEFASELTAGRARYGALTATSLEGSLGGDGSAVDVAIRRGRLNGAPLRADIDIALDEEPEVRLEARLERLDLASFLTALEVPLEGLEGRVAVEGEYTFATSAPTEGRGLFRVRAEPVSLSRRGAAGTGGATEAPPGSEGLALRGELELTLAGGRLEFRDRGLTAPGQRIEVSGRLDLAELAGRAGYRIETTDPRALMRLLPALYEEGEPAWEPSSGRGALWGDARFAPAGFAASLSLDLESVTISGTEIARLAGELELDSGGVQRLALEAERDAERLVLAATFPFANPAQGYAPPPFRFDIESDGWQLADAAPFLPLDLPGVRAAVYGSVALWGDAGAPVGEIDARLADIAYGGLEIPGRIEGALRFDPVELTVGPLRYSGEAGDMELSGRVDLVDERLDLDLVSSPLSLSAEPFDSLIVGDLTGSVELRAGVRGELATPEMEVVLAASGLTLAEESLGDAGTSRLTITTDRESLRAEGSILGLLDVKGGGRWTEEGFDLEIALESAQPRRLMLLALGDAPTDLDGRLEGLLRMRSGGDAPSGGLEVTTLELRTAGRRLETAQPILLRFDASGAALEMHLVEAGSENYLSLVGPLLDESGEMDLGLHSEVDASWLGLFLPDLKVSGSLTVLAAIRGPLSAPDLDGRGRVTDGRLLIEGFPHAVEDARGLLLFDPGRIVLDSGQAKFARGRLTLAGSVLLDEEGGNSYELRMQATDLDLRYPEDWRIQGDGRWTLSSTAEGHLLSGVVMVERATYVRDFKLGFTQLLRAMFQQSPQLVDETDDLLLDTRLNIRVEGPEALNVKTDLATLEGDLDFSIRGNLAQPVILGDIHLDRGGTVDLGSVYTVERGSLRFSNPFRNEPYVDLVASARIREYDVRLNLFGPFDELETSVSSTPPLPTLDVLSLLTTGRADALSSFDRGSGGGEASAAESFLASQAASLAGQRVGELFGLDQVTISPLTQGTSELSTARITVGKEISRDVYVTYSYDPSRSDEELFELTWQLYPSISVILTRNDSGAFIADLRWRRTF